MSRTITESPDKFMHDGSVWAVEDPDAYTFIYRVQDELLFKAKSETREHKGRMFHFDMVRLLTMIGKIFRDESWYAYDEEAEDYEQDPRPITTVDDFNQHCELMGHDIYWDDAGGWVRSGKASMQIYGDTQKMIRFCESIADLDVESVGDSVRMKYSSIGVFGRYWEDTEVSSFWLNKRDLGRLIAKGGLDGYFEYLGIDKGNARLNSVETREGIFGVQHALAAAGKKPTMTRDQERELMMKQHLDPDSKRKLNVDADQIDKYGGVLPAQYHAWSRTSDGIIKLGDLLKECPDAVVRDDGSHEWFWYEGQNWAFICFPEFSIAVRGKTHSQIIKLLIRTRADMSMDYIHVERDEGGEMLYVSDEDDVLSALADAGSVVNDVLDNGYADGDYREDGRLLVGRLWTDRDVISFWNNQHDVLHNWKMAERMFHDIPTLGHLTDYTVDWTERDADASEGLTPREMTPAEDISRGTFHGNRSADIGPDQEDLSKVPQKDPKDDSGQLNFLAKMFQEPQLLDKVDDGILKKIRDKVHVLDPQAKAQVLKAAGDLPRHKAVEIADKLGMSVAEFNHIMHVNESSIQLRNLIPLI